MAVSTIPVFKATLLGQLQARTGLYDVQVTWGFPVGAPAAEWLMLGNVNGDQSAAALGHLRRDEDYNLEVMASVVRAGRGIQAAVERAWVLAAEVENELRTNPTVNETVRVAQINGPIRSEEFYDGEKCEGRVTLTVNAVARI